ncbi:MAG: HAD family hydrolase [bacterium]
MPSLPRLIALDLDRTLLPVDDHRIPDINLQALRELHAAGVLLAVITGRRRTTLEPYMEQIGLPILAGSNSGTQLWQLPDWSRLDSRPLEHVVLERAVALLEPHSLNIYFAWDDADPMDFAWLRRAESTLQTRYFSEYGLRGGMLYSLAELPRREVLQLSMPGPEELVLDCLKLMRRELGNELFAECVLWPRMPCHALELFHPDGNKGWALARLAELHGIAIADTMAVGDDTNDLPMLAAAGHSLAMGHAHPQALRLATQVLPDEGEQALGRYLLSLLA